MPTLNVLEEPTEARQRAKDRQQRHATRSATARGIATYGPAVLIVIAVAVGVALSWLLRPAPVDDPRGVWEPVSEDLVQHETEYRYDGDPQAIGNADAMTTIVMFTDFLCAACATFDEQIVPEINEHIDAGIVRIEYRDIGLRSDAADRAARAGYAAGQQDAYQAFRDRMHKQGQNASDYTEKALVDVADELGLDTGQFRDDMRSPEARAVIDGNNEMYEETYFTVVPSAVAGGTLIHGSQPSSVYTEWLDQFWDLPNIEGEPAP